MPYLILRHMEQFILPSEHHTHLATESSIFLSYKISHFSINKPKRKQDYSNNFNYPY